MYAAAHAPMGGDAAVQQVARTLRGPVTDILRRAVPQLKGYGREDAYERIMNSPELASRCVHEFRARPELFRALMIGPDRRPVTKDTQHLSCGRTLAQVIALIVRAVAKRHFRQRLGSGPQSGGPRRKKESRLGRLVRRLVGRPRRKAVAAARVPTRAELLYQELRDFLVFEWQLPLIPHYVDIPLPLLKALGPDILQYREPDELRELARNGLQPARLPEGEGAVPAEAAQGANSLFDGELPDAIREQPDISSESAAASINIRLAASPTARAEAMWTVAQSLNLAALFGCDEREMRRTIAHASAVGPAAMAALAAAGLRPRETVVVLCAIARRIGDGQMVRMLGSEPSRRFLGPFAAMLQEQGVSAMRQPANVKEATETILARLKIAAPAVRPMEKRA